MRSSRLGMMQINQPCLSYVSFLFITWCYIGIYTIRKIRILVLDSVSISSKCEWYVNRFIFLSLFENDFSYPISELLFFILCVSAWLSIHNSVRNKGPWNSSLLVIDKIHNLFHPCILHFFNNIRISTYISWMILNRSVVFFPKGIAVHLIHIC